ncbi:MAG: hypothetical protein SRB1_02603 [Desulfobacteraceae bacterium Eth-SRB1]|nr:MAG: hypothetical protein SRB1_02603 [Desulfobacteraceae bacterium Eth-SRB1]
MFDVQNFLLLESISQAMAGRCAGRTGYPESEETKDTHYDIEQNRIGHTDCDNNNT